MVRSTIPFLTGAGRSFSLGPFRPDSLLKGRSFVSFTKMKRFLFPCKTVLLFRLADIPDYACHAARIAKVISAMIMGLRVPALPDRSHDLGIAFQVTNIACGAAPGALLLIDRPRPAAHGMACGPFDLAQGCDASGLFGQVSLPRRPVRGIAAARRICRETGRPVRCGGLAAWDQHTRVAAPCGAIAGAAGLRDGWCPALPAATPRDGIWPRPLPF